MRDGNLTEFNQLVADQNYGDLLIFCGAGISYDPPTKIPTVSHFVDSVVCEVLPDNALRNDILKHVQEPSYNPRFEVLVDDIRKYHDSALEISSIFSSNGFNKTHYAIGQLVLKGATVVTTNFDCCIENAIGPSPFESVIFEGFDLRKQHSSHGATVIKPHGSFSTEKQTNNLVISISRLAKLNHGFNSMPIWRQFLLNTLKDKSIVFIGYSGSDDFDLTPIIVESGFKRAIWIEYDFKQKKLVFEPKKSLGTHSIKGLSNVSVFKGRPNDLLASWVSQTLYDSGVNLEPPQYSVKTYLDLMYKSSVKRKELLTTILFHYQGYNLIKRVVKNKFSSILLLNSVRGLFFQGRHSEVVKTLSKLSYSGLPYMVASKLAYIHSTSLFYSGEFVEAERLGNEYFRMAENDKDMDSQIHSLVQLGSLAFNRADYDLAEDYYLRSLSLQENSPNIEGFANCFWGLASVSQMKDDFTQAKNYYEQALEQLENLRSFIGVAYVQHNLGLLNLITENLVTAEMHLISSENTFQRILKDNVSDSGQQGLIYSQLTLAKLHYKKVDFNLFGNKISTALKLLKSCVGHPNFHEIVVTYIYSVWLNSGLDMVIEKIAEIKESEFYFVIKEREYETAASGENVAQGYLFSFFDFMTKDQLVSQIKSFESKYIDTFFT